MNRLPILILTFALSTLLFILVVVFLRFAFPPFPLMSYQDVVGLLPPLVFIPIYWLIFRHATTETSLGQEVAFMMLAALWVEGQAIHLAANSIDNLIAALARNHVIDITPTDVYRLAFFFDEHLGHYLMHVGMLGLAALLIYREWRKPVEPVTMRWAIRLAGVIYGAVYFCLFIEGGTVALGLPFALVVILIAAIAGRKVIQKRPLLAFFALSSLVAIALFAGWGLYWGGFPQFSEVRML